MPRSAEDRLGDLIEEDFAGAGAVTAADLRSRMTGAFDIHVILGGIAALYLPFALFLETPTAALVALLAVAAIALRLRDAWIHPAKGTPDEAVMDVIVTASAVLVSQAVFMFAVPSLRMPPPILIPGLTAGVILAAVCRMFVHLNRLPDVLRRRDAVRSYTHVALITVLWIVAGVAVVALGLVAVPETIHGRDLLLTFWAGSALPIAHRLRLEGIHPSGLRHMAEKILVDPLKQELELKINRTWRPAKDRLSLWIEASFFVMMAVPLALAVWDSYTGAAVIIDSRQLTVNSAAMVTLSMLWFEIKKMNLDAAAELQEQLDQIDG
jgi:hypothetical protein